MASLAWNAARTNTAFSVLNGLRKSRDGAGKHRWVTFGLDCELSIRLSTVPIFGVRPAVGWNERFGLTNSPGFQRDEKHGEAPFPERRVQAAGSAGVRCWRDPAWALEAARHLSSADPPDHEPGIPRDAVMIPRASMLRRISA